VILCHYKSYSNSASTPVQEGFFAVLKSLDRNKVIEDSSTRLFLYGMLHVAEYFQNNVQQLVSEVIRKNKYSEDQLTGEKKGMNYYTDKSVEKRV